MRTTRRLGLALLTVALLQAGCHGADTVTGPARATYSISGTVKSDAVAVHGAWVELQNGPFFRATTDADGRFTLHGVPAGTWVVTVRANGFETAARTVTVGPDATGVIIDLRAAPPGNGF